MGNVRLPEESCDQTELPAHPQVGELCHCHLKWGGSSSQGYEMLLRATKVRSIWWTQAPKSLQSSAMQNICMSCTYLFLWYIKYARCACCIRWLLNGAGGRREKPRGGTSVRPVLTDSAQSLTADTVADVKYWLWQQKIVLRVIVLCTSMPLW